MIQPSRGRKLTPAELADVRLWWKAGMAVTAICAQLRLTRDAFEARRKDQLADLEPRPRGVGSRTNKMPDPTPEEIAERAAAIRAAWTDAERRERMATGKLPPVRERVVSLSEIAWDDV